MMIGEQGRKRRKWKNHCLSKENKFDHTFYVHCSFPAAQSSIRICSAIRRHWNWNYREIVGSRRIQLKTFLRLQPCSSQVEFMKLAFQFIQFIYIYCLGDIWKVCVHNISELITGDLAINSKHPPICWQTRFQCSRCWMTCLPLRLSLP